MAIDYSNIRIIDNIPKNPTPKEQEAIDKIETEIAKYCAKRLIEKFTTEELDVGLPLLLEIENLVNQGISLEDAKKQVTENYYKKIEESVKEFRDKKA